MTNDEIWMQRALELAECAEQAGEVPVGALVVKDATVIAEGWNQPISTQDPTAHAEIVALRAAAQSLANYRLPDLTLYVTLEPCPMCAGAIVQARLARVVYGAADPRAGAVKSVFNILGAPSLNHRPRVTDGVLAQQCGEKLKRFFEAKR